MVFQIEPTDILYRNVSYRIVYIFTDAKLLFIHFDTDSKSSFA